MVFWWFFPAGLLNRKNSNKEKLVILFLWTINHPLHRPLSASATLEFGSSGNGCACLLVSVSVCICFRWHPSCGTRLLVFCFGQVIEWVVMIEGKDFLLEISVQLNLPERTSPDLNWLSFVWLINRWLGGSTTVEFAAQTYNNDMTIRFLFSSISSFIYHTVMTNDEYQIQRFRMDLQFVEWLWEKFRGSEILQKRQETVFVKVVLVKHF